MYIWQYYITVILAQLKFFFKHGINHIHINPLAPEFPFKF